MCLGLRGGGSGGLNIGDNWCFMWFIGFVNLLAKSPTLQSGHGESGLVFPQLEDLQVPKAYVQLGCDPKPLTLNPKPRSDWLLSTLCLHEQFMQQGGRQQWKCQMLRLRWSKPEYWRRLLIFIIIGVACKSVEIIVSAKSSNALYWEDPYKRGPLHNPYSPF